MENIIDSNERTLVIFDSVCSGLIECLSLVDSDIKHMTKHRNKLVLFEQQQQQQHELIREDSCLSGRLQASITGADDQFPSQPPRPPPQPTSNYLLGMNSSSLSSLTSSSPSSNQDQFAQNQQQFQHNNNIHHNNHYQPHHNHHHHQHHQQITTIPTNNQHQNYLDGLELLDKQLAESFSQAFNLNDQHKSSILAKEKQAASQSGKPSIFQVLLGKPWSSTFKSSSSSSRTSSTKDAASAANSNHSPSTSSAASSEGFLTRCRRRSNSEKSLNKTRHQEFGVNKCDINGYGRGCERPAPVGVDNKLIIDDINKQIRLAMQYSKQLETHLLKIEDLRSKFEMHLKMGMVVKGGVSTYLPHSTSASFIENIDKIEAEFESHMGSFLFSIEDIQGFARVCQGDNFEISIKYGDSQKFKTKIAILKGDRQKCDNRQAVFKARIADRLAIKAYECKGLGKRILLGHKLCETRDLFTARSQLMTISLNQTGSIKLNLIVTWNPLHMVPNNGPLGVDISHISLTDTPIYS